MLPHPAGPLQEGCQGRPACLRARRCLQEGDNLQSFEHTITLEDTTKGNMFSVSLSLSSAGDSPVVCFGGRWWLVIHKLIDSYITAQSPAAWTGLDWTGQDRTCAWSRLGRPR